MFDSLFSTEAYRRDRFGGLCCKRKRKSRPRAAPLGRARLHTIKPLTGIHHSYNYHLAATPLFWVVPLAIYLVTFVLAFARRPPLRHAVMVQLLPVILITLVVCGPLVQQLPVFGLMLGLNLGCFFAIAMVCHGQLARERPKISRLTEFYFYISLGGVLGGLFNAILAPMLFPGVWEFPLVLVLACLLCQGVRIISAVSSAAISCCLWRYSLSL